MSSPSASSSPLCRRSGGSARGRTWRSSWRTRTWRRCSTACSGCSTASPSSTPTASSSPPSMASASSSIFFLYSPNKKRLRMMAVLGVELVFMVAVILGVLLGAHTHEKRSMIVGILCVFFGSIMYFSPLTIMGKVIKTKSVEYMPFFLSLVCFLNGVCWTAYALIRFDIYVTIPNGVGALFGAIQLILYACYYRTTPKKTKAAKDVEMPSVDISGPGAAGGGSVTVER